MGKVKRPKSKPKRNNPAGSRNGESSTVEEELTSNVVPTETSISTAKKQLQAPDLEDKLCGLQTLATLLESQEYAEQLVQQSVIRVAAPLLLDDNPAVRNATAGTLRNFSTLGLDACEYLIGQDTMTPLIAFFAKYAVDWIPKQTNTGKLDEDADTFLQSVHLLWNLCESSGTSIKIVNESNVLPILMRCLDKETFGNEMVAAVLHFLFVVIEDNVKASAEIKNSFEEPIRKIFTSSDSSPSELLLRMLSVGIIINLQPENMKSLPPEMLCKVMSTLVDVMTVDVRVACNKLSSILPLSSASGNPEASKHKQNVEIDRQVDDLKNLIDAQQTAMEILTNICSYEEQDEDCMETDNVSDADSDMEDDNMDSCTNGADTSYSADNLPIEVIEMFTAHQLVEKVWSKTSLPPENVITIFEDSDEGKHLNKRLRILQSRSLLCMNNLISNLPLDILGGYERIYKIWMETGKLVFQSSNVDEEILESATAVMRAVLDRFKPDGQKPSGTSNLQLFKELTVDDIQIMLEGITQCQSAEIRANLTRMIGNLALILSTDQQTSCDILLALVGFILERSCKETECWVLAEVLDTIMDLFAEDETDALAAQINLIDKLNFVMPTFRTKVQQQKKTLGDHSAMVSTVVSNLPRFIKYKRKRVANLRR